VDFGEVHTNTLLIKYYAPENMGKHVTLYRDYDKWEKKATKALEKMIVFSKAIAICMFKIRYNTFIFDGRQINSDENTKDLEEIAAIQDRIKKRKLGGKV